MVPSSSILDAGSLHILEQLKYGKINIRQAAELLKVEPTILAYELAAKVRFNKGNWLAQVIQPDRYSVVQWNSIFWHLSLQISHFHKA